MRAYPILLAAPALVAALTGCTASDAETPEATEEFQVPAGVVEQYEVLADEVAERGGSVTEGEWTVNYIVEAAEPWFESHGHHASFREPTADETHHLEIIPTETSTGRIVPEVPIVLEVIDEDGKVADRRTLDFYYSTFYHYATNFEVPEDGTYTLRATLGAPDFLRHGEESEGPALAEGATIEFTDVELATE